MSNKIPSLLLFSALMWIMLIFVINIGCQFQRGIISKTAPLPSLTGITAVLGFRPAMSQGEGAGVIRNPISGAVFMAEPIPPDVPDKMTTKLFSKMKDYEGYELVDLDKERGILASLLVSDQGMNDIETFKRIGNAFSANAVMVGYIYRWQERKGTDYSVDRPASVAFDIYLLRSEDGAILWRGKFDKTQAPLSENILDAVTFFKGKGKWMTVESLADLGLSDILEKALPEVNK